jgi:hypothetical protein
LETLERAYQREEFEIARWRSHHRLELAIGTALGCISLTNGSNDVHNMQLQNLPETVDLCIDQVHVRVAVPTTRPLLKTF